jgi:hypothetical protein
MGGDAGTVSASGATGVQVSSDFWVERFDTGIHICQLFSNEDDRLDSMAHYLASGIAAGQKCGCCTLDDAPLGDAQSALGDHLASSNLTSSGLSVKEACISGQLSFVEADNVLLTDGRFDPERLLSRLSEFCDSARGEGWSGALIVAEISPAIPEVTGGGRLIEFEVEVNRLLLDRLLLDRPMAIVCQYDLRRFDGAILMEVLRVHPFIMIRGSVMRNPFYLSAENALAAA